MFLPPASRTTRSGRIAPFRRGHGDLLVEVAPGAHPGQLDHTCAAAARPAALAASGRRKRGDQRLRLRPQLLRGVSGQVDLLGQRGVRPVPGRVGFRAAALRPGPRVSPQRLDQVLDRRAAQVEFAGRGRVRGPQPASATSRNGRCSRPAPARTAPGSARPAGHRPARPARPRHARSSWLCPRRPARSSAAASRPRANRYPIAAPMKNPEQQSDQQQDCTHMQR